MKKPLINKELMRSFGRVNGRKLRPGQLDYIEKLLPQFAVKLPLPLGEGWGEGRPNNKESIKISDIFLKEGTLTPALSQRERELWLEIGFGYGEHLVGMAQKYPDVNFIGCEPFINGVATLLKHIEDSGVKNIRILHGDARLLIEKLEVGSVERLFLLFPDPWPKARHHKKRFVSNENLKLLARVIRSGGRLDIATDHVDYGLWIDEHLRASEDFKENTLIGVDAVPDDWVETRYQQKAKIEGRAALFFNYVRV